MFLDDDEERHELFRLRLGEHLSKVKLRQVMTAQEAIDALKTEDRFDVLSLDYDLDLTSELEAPQGFDPAEWKRFMRAMEKEKGLAVATFVASKLPQAKIPSMVIIHSVNRAGARRMARVLSTRIKEVHVQPFFDGLWV